MAEEFSSSRIQLHNNTYVDNKDYGYPAGALTLEDSLHFPTLVDVSQSINVSELITTLPGAFCSFRFFAEAGTTYEIFPNTQSGTANLVGETYRFMGSDSEEQFSVNVTDVGAGGYQVGINWVTGLGVPVSEEQKVLASNAGANDFFGWSTSISGNIMVVGAPNEDTQHTNSGAAYVYERNLDTGVWEEVAMLIAPDGGYYIGTFGWSVAIYENTLVVGSKGESKAYIFDRDANTGVWGHAKTLTGHDTSVSDEFGYSVTIYGDTIVVGATRQDVGLTDTGCAYVFDRNINTGVWVESKTLYPTVTYGSDYFGSAVSLYDNLLVVGAYGNYNGYGSLYFFERDTDTGIWSAPQRRQASTKGSGDNFGTSVSIYGNTAIGGAPGEDVSTNSGAAFVFTRDTDTGTWSQSKVLRASTSVYYGSFGKSVSIYFTTLVVGSIQEYGNATNGDGAAYVFELDVDTTTWNETQIIKASDAQQLDYFGRSVCVRGTTLVVGASGEDAGGSAAGAAYIFS